MTQTIFTAIGHASARVGDRLAGVSTVTSPPPNFSGPGSSALQTISGIVLGDVITVAVIAGLIGALLIVVGHFSSNHRVQKTGIIGVLSVIGGVAVAASIVGLINFGASLKIA
jgi:hypothetical protein